LPVHPLHKIASGHLLMKFKSRKMSVYLRRAQVRPVFYTGT